MNRLVIIDYGMGNLRSVANAFAQACPDITVKISSSAADIISADRVVFPGQGAMPDCMAQLKHSGLIEPIYEAARTKPFLGICLGLQMLYEASEEGNSAGFGLLKGNVKRFPDNRADVHGLPLKVPHMGWAQVKQTVSHPLWTAISDKSWFYFVHSYYANPEFAQHTAGISHYGADYCCAVAHRNIFATQFHPEKSGTIGLQLLYNFSIWQPFFE